MPQSLLLLLLLLLGSATTNQRANHNIASNGIGRDVTRGRAYQNADAIKALSFFANLIAVLAHTNTHAHNRGPLPFLTYRLSCSPTQWLARGLPFTYKDGIYFEGHHEGKIEKSIEVDGPFGWLSDSWLELVEARNRSRGNDVVLHANYVGQLRLMLILKLKRDKTLVLAGLVDFPLLAKGIVKRKERERERPTE